MRAETVVLAIRKKQEAGALSLDQGTRLLLAWNAIQNLDFMRTMYEDKVREMAQDALGAIGQAQPKAIEQLEIEMLDYLELI